MCFEHGHFVNENWDSKHENSEEWVCDQCKHGLGYGVFESDQNIKDKLPLSWMVACKGYVCKYVLCNYIKSSRNKKGRKNFLAAPKMVSLSTAGS